MTKFSENFTYKIDGKKVASMGDFYFLTQGNTYDIEIDGLEVNAKRIDNLNKPFFLDEAVSDSFSPRNKDKTEEELLTEITNKNIDNTFDSTIVKVSNTLAQKEKINELRNNILVSNRLSGLSSIIDTINAKTEEELADILKRDMNIGAPNWQENNTGGSVFERVQDTTKADYIDLCSNIKRDKIFDFTSSPFATTIRESLEGKKETDGKLDYSEINFELVDLMAKRFMDNKHKYPKGNTLKVINKDEILWAAFRHIRKMIQPIKNDPETYKEHLAAVATNMSIILDQLKNE